MTSWDRAAERPLVLRMPLFVSDMSFGSLSREAKIALAEAVARRQAQSLCPTLVALAADLDVEVSETSRLGGGDVAESYRVDLDDGRTVFAKTHRNPPAGFTWKTPSW